MKNLFTTFLLFACGACNLSFGQLVFENIFSGIGAEHGYSVELCDDGYLVAGSTNSSGAGQNDILLIKTDLTGNSQWKKTYGGYYDDIGIKVRKVSDANYVIAGTTKSFTSDSADFYILKIDTAGTLIWSQVFGGPRIDSVTSFIQTADGNLMILGSTNSIGAGNADVYLLKLDLNGNYIWSKSMGNTGNDVPTAILEMEDNGFFITGYTNGFGFAGNTPFLMRIDANGDFQWMKTYDGPAGFDSPKDCRANDIIKGYNNDFVLIGTAGLDFVGASVFIAIDIDSLGATNWSKRIQYNSGPAIAKTISKTGDNHYIIGGSCAWYPAATLLKLNVLGVPQWVWAYTGSEVSQVKSTSDNQYIATGTNTESGDSKLVLIKPDENGTLSCSSDLPFFFGDAAYSPAINNQSFTSTSTIFTLLDSCIEGISIISDSTLCIYTNVQTINSLENGISVFPNPFENVIQVKSTEGKEEIILFDILSRKLLQHTFTNSTTLNTEQLAKGIYIYQVRNTKGVVRSGKVVKE